MSALLLAVLALPSAAQEFDAHGFVVAPLDGDLRDSLSTERPGYMAKGDAYAGGLFEFAKAPLVEVRTVAGETTRTPVVDNVTALNLSAGFTIHERVRLDVRMPIYLTSFDVDGNSQGVDSGVLRLSSMVLAVAPQDASGVGVGIVPWLDLPTGTEALLNTGKLSGGAKVAFTKQADILTMSANLGMQFNPDAGLGNLQGQEQLVAGLGGTWMINEGLAVGIEGVSRIALSKNEQPGTNAPTEIIAHLRGRKESGLHYTLGGAAGVTQGASAARFRLFLGLGWGKVSEPYVAPPIVDTDGDGLLDPDDQCVTEPETVNDYQDEDGCPDSTDGSLTVHVHWEGAPVGGADVVLTGPDGDETFTKAESSVEKAAVPGDSHWAASAKKGVCLAGSGEIDVGIAEAAKLTIELERVILGKADITVMNGKGKPIPEATIRWMTDTPECVPSLENVNAEGKLIQELGGGTHTIVVEAPGFASHVQEVEVGEVDIVLSMKLKSTKLRVEEKKIVILDKVFFESGKDVIKSQSFELLDQVATTIRTNPQMGKLEVAGHTDSQGSRDSNLGLSQRRAEAVVKYLTDKGVKPERLIAKGYGPDVPIDDNKTSKGRANNRRVEFDILDKPAEEPAPEAAPNKVKPAEPAPEATPNKVKPAEPAPEATPNKVKPEGAK